MKLFISFLIIIAATSCTTKKKSPKLTKQNNTAATSPALINYDSCKKQITVLKNTYGATWKNMDKLQKEKIVVKAVTETIIPCWVGTKWDFNGTTEVPQKGAIACGYFVTTVLRDAGFYNIARVKLAQCASEQMITSLVHAKNIQRFSNIAITDFIAAVSAKQYGLFIVGLDNHTGFIYNDGKDVFFIHATFVGTRNVQEEKAINSWVLKQSRYKVLAKLTADEQQLANWIN